MKDPHKIALVLSPVGFYLYILDKAKVINTRVAKPRKVVEHYTQACSCIIFMHYATLGGPSWFLPLVRQKAFEGFLFLFLFILDNKPGISWQLL